MEFEPKLSPRFVVYLRDYLLDRNIDPEPLLASCEISQDSMDAYGLPVPVSKIAKLFERAVEITKNSYVGLHMGQRFHYESSGLVVLAMLAAPSVEEGIKILFRYDKFVDTCIDTRFEVGPDIAVCVTNIIDPTGSRVDQINEYLLTFLVQTLCKATRKQVPLKEVWFRHQCGKDEKPLRAFFNAPIKFGQADNKIIFDREYLKARFLTSNNLLFEILTKALKTYFSYGGDNYDFIDSVCREITRQTAEESPSLETIAESLALSPRTLRRRMADAGYTFQEVKNLARENRAKYYLANTSMALSEIAFELGYSELSAFSRAFRAWTGETPQAYREKIRRYYSGPLAAK